MCVEPAAPSPFTNPAAFPRIRTKNPHNGAMPHFARRHVLAGLVGLAAGLPGLARGQAVTLDPASDANQTTALQRALDAAAVENGRISLPAGRFRVSDMHFPSNLVLEGVPGATWLIADGQSVGAASNQSSLVLRDIGFAGDSGTDPLLSVDNSQSITLERCTFRDNPGVGLNLFASAATIRDCDFGGHGDAAIHSLNALGLLVTGNRIATCGNAGIRIWRSESGADGSIVTNNRISNIDWRGGGNGQNGNGINVYLADEVIVADNHITDCAFSAVRLNTTRNSVVKGNQCHRSGEVAIFSEFAFSGSIIADNIIDGAAAGISITNMDVGGALAVCSGNIVRNITPASRVNPDATPIGIFAEADTAISGNVIAGVPGPAIAAGWGPYLRNVAISGNMVTESQIGIAVSVAEGAGPVTIGANQLSVTGQEIVGMLWRDMAEPDLAAAADRYLHVTFR